ncbi:MAG TPA: glycosyltransferase family 2 protein [Candidatus Saccharimonadia bacterium]|nr:glycosyltransferase family 2 protein [Candidatus Saccharimonadia bacterium]
MTKSTLISIIIPCHNEVANLGALHTALDTATKPLADQFEFIFVDDGSTDTTLPVLRQLCLGDPRVRTIELVRNFGKEIAVSAGLHAARGQAGITIDADLQHPPALIPELIAAWRAGAEVAIGVRRRGHDHAPVLKRAGSSLFYRLINAISGVEIRAGASDYRLLDRIVIDEFNRFTERGRLTRGLVDWLGFRRAYVEFVPAKRHAGIAAYSYQKLFGLAVTSVVSMSFFPLRLAGYLGLLITLISGPLGIFIFVEKYLLRDPWGLSFSGPAILAVILLFLVGIILICLGLIAMYIANIHTEVMNRPLYVARPENHLHAGKAAE